MWTSQDNLQLLTNISNNLLLSCSASGQIDYYNKRAAFLFPDKEKNYYLQHLWGLDNQSLIHKKLQEMNLSGQPQMFSLTNNRRQYNFYLYPSAAGAAICVDDITERRELGSILHETTMRLNFAEKIARIGYWEMDLKARQIFWSSEMFRIFDVDARHISTKRNIIKEQIFSDDLPIYKSKLRELLKFGRPVEGRVRIKRRSGQITYCFFKADIIKLPNQSKIAGTFQDLTELLETQKALDKARQIAEQANRAKSYFLAQASHDLRQPLQALNIFINLLEEENLPERQKTLVEKIGASANSLRNLLDNLLDISKLEVGGTSVHKSVFNIGQLLENIIAEYQDIAADKQIDLQFVPCRSKVYSDPVLIERIIRNYLSNALKYTQNRLLIGCRRSNSKLKITVNDNGPGIKLDEQKLIFDEFYQSGNIPDNKKNGSGLGLTIVKKISDLLGAEVGVDSKIGEGSTFWLELDAATL